MNTVTIPDFLPQLHRGAQEVGSGKACINNAIAYMSGDAVLSDMPDCVYPPFARMAQMVNDNICDHTPCSLCESAAQLKLSHICDTALCPACSHRVWLMGAQLIGTAELVKDMTWEQERRAAIAIGAALVDWEVERHHLQRADETFESSGVPVSPVTWARMLNEAQSVAGGAQASWWQQSPITLGWIEEGGGQSLVIMHRLIHATSRRVREDMAAELARCYFRQTFFAYPLLSPERFGSLSLLAKIPQLVGILRRAAGRAAQADIVITAEQVAKVPVAVA